MAFLYLTEQGSVLRKSGERFLVEKDARIVLAGGLNPTRVSRAIAAIRPDVVDVSSGVESAPGVKDHQLMSEFVQAVRASR